MNDMRQKLLPVFLEEAGRKLLQLDAFLALTTEKQKTLADLESAFRAAHTLKGTAALVQAEAVRSLAGRIEGLLEGHFELSRFPSEVECEAMLLALDRLKQLVSAVEKGIAEPPGIVAEAELALKMAMAMPGRRRLAELFEQESLNDPFAEDPLIDNPIDIPEVAATVSQGDDPFADDPDFDAKPILSAPAVDLFAEDPCLEPEAEIKSGSGVVVADPFEEDPAFDAPDSATVSGIAAGTEIDDPFSDDPALESLDTLDETSRKKDAGEGSVKEPLAEDPEPDAEMVSELPADSEPVPVPEESFAQRMRRRIEKESALGTAERLATTLLMQKDADVNEREFACCRFRVAEKDYYLPIVDMVEIADLPDIIRLPLAPPIVRGLVNLRGRVLPLIDLSVQDGTVSTYVAVQKMIVADGGDEQLAFLVDGIPDLSQEISGERVDVKRFIEQFRAGAS